MKRGALVVMVVLFSIFFAFAASQAKPFKIAAIFQTAIEEPWDGVIHKACLKAQKEMGNIEYEFTENGIDQNHRIINSTSPDPFLIVSKLEIKYFQENIKLVDLINLTEIELILKNSRIF